MNEVLQCLACGRTFLQSNAYSIHVGSCRPQKKRMASALELAKETFKKKKLRMAENPNTQQQQLSESQPVAGPSIEVSCNIFSFVVIPLIKVQS